MNEQESELTIDLGQIWTIIKRGLHIIIAVAVVFALLGYVISEIFIEPEYKATATLYINDEGSSDVVNSTTLSFTEKLVNGFVFVIKSDKVLDRVINELDLDYTAEQLRNKLSTESVSNTSGFYLSVKDSDPVLAMNIVNEIVKIAPDEVKNVIDAGNLKVVDNAKLPDEPVSSSSVVKAVIAAVIGAVLAVAVLILIALTDRKIRTEDDLAQIGNLPVFGVIPTIKVSVDE